MKVLGVIAAMAVWVFCWLIAPASWWLNERVLDEQWFESAMVQVLQIEDVDREITDRATAQVMQDARTFVADNVPFLSTPADALLDRAEPTVSGVVNTAFMMGGALGLAVLVAVSDSRFAALLADGEDRVAALNGGLNVAFAVGAVFALSAAAIGGILLRPKPMDMGEGPVAVH